MTQTLTALAPLVVAAFVLVGVPLMLWRTACADAKTWSRNPSSGSTNAGHTHPQTVSGWTGVETQPPAPSAAPPIPQMSAGVDASPHSTPADFDSPLPTELGGRGTGVPPGPSAPTGPTASVGGAPARYSPPTGHYPGDHRG